MNNRQIGAEYEQKAVRYLEENGYLILERNFRVRFGEIDIIAQKDGCLVFAEVKYRSTPLYGSPLEAVDIRKQKQIRKVAKCYLMQKGKTEWTAGRFDVIAFEGERMSHLENAF